MTLKLTPQKAAELLKELQYAKVQMGGQLSIRDEYFKQALEKQPQWIPCSERMPPKGKPGSSCEYLVYETLNNRVQHDYYNVPDTMSPFWNHYDKYVTHWMPLPEAPL